MSTPGVNPAKPQEDLNLENIFAPPPNFGISNAGSTSPNAVGSRAASSTLSKINSSAKLTLKTNPQNTSQSTALTSGKVSKIDQDQLIDQCKTDLKNAIKEKKQLAGAAKKRATTMKTWGVAGLVLGFLVIGAGIAATALFPPAGIGILLGAMLLGAMGVGCMAIMRSKHPQEAKTKKTNDNSKELKSEINKLTQYQKRYNDPNFISYLKDRPHLASFDKIDELHSRYDKIKDKYAQILDSKNKLDIERDNLIEHRAELEVELNTNLQGENTAAKIEINRLNSRIEDNWNQKKALIDLEFKLDEELDSLEEGPQGPSAIQSKMEDDDDVEDLENKLSTLPTSPSSTPTTSTTNETDVTASESSKPDTTANKENVITPDTKIDNLSQATYIPKSASTNTIHSDVIAQETDKIDAKNQSQSAPPTFRSPLETIRGEIPDVVDEEINVLDEAEIKRQGSAPLTMKEFSPKERLSNSIKKKEELYAELLTKSSDFSDIKSEEEKIERLLTELNTNPMIRKRDALKIQRELEISKKSLENLKEIFCKKYDISMDQLSEFPFDSLNNDLNKTFDDLQKLKIKANQYSNQLKV